MLSQSIGGLSIQVNPNIFEQQSQQDPQCKSFHSNVIYILTFADYAPLDPPTPLDFPPVPMPPPEPTETPLPSHTFFPFGAFNFDGDIEPEEEGLFDDNDDETLHIPHAPDNPQTHSVQDTFSALGITSEAFQSRLHHSPFIVSIYIRISAQKLM